MYESPLTIAINKATQSMNYDLENQILEVVQKAGIHVNKEELVKALNYDRGQYEKGYNDCKEAIEHPAPLNAEDIKVGMYVWDKEIDYVFKVDDFFISCIEDMENKNERFYEVHIPKTEEK